MWCELVDVKDLTVDNKPVLNLSAVITKYSIVGKHISIKILIEICFSHSRRIAELEDMR